MKLTETEAKLTNKKIANFFKTVLNMDKNTPTNWILWEVNQPHIQQILQTRKLRYWWKKLQSEEYGLATQITKQESSTIHREVDMETTHRENTEESRNEIPYSTKRRGEMGRTKPDDER